MPNNIKLIIFDFDGTLGDTRRNIVTTTLFPDIQEELITRCSETYRRIFNENLKKIQPQAFPGVVDTLAALHQKGIVLTIASSRSRNSLTELTHNMGIADYISLLLGADDVKEAKPKPEPVLKTLETMHFDASETLVVGDMAVDIMMGANAGAKTCGVTWGNGTEEELKEARPEFIIDRIEDLLKIVNYRI